MTGIKCCVCGDGTSLSPIVIEDEKAFLPDQSSDARAVYAKAKVFAITDQDSDYIYYGIFQCQSCGARFIAQKKYRDGTWVAVYPIPHKSVAQEIPEPIRGEFEEANLCFAVGAYRATVSMCHISLEALWRDKGVSGLQELKDEGLISQQLYDRANEIRHWANVAKHEPIPDVVDKEDAEQLITYFEAILDHVYIQQARLDALKQKRQKLEKKQP